MRVSEGRSEQRHTVVDNNSTPGSTRKGIGFCARRTERRGGEWDRLRASAARGNPLAQKALQQSLNLSMVRNRTAQQSILTHDTTGNILITNCCPKENL
jgi:hypothetical protein